MDLYLFVDDERNVELMYDQSCQLWATARTYEEAVDLITNNTLKAISLDHDLGEGNKTGYDLAKWLTENDKWPEAVFFHSQNPVGRQNMKKEYEFWLKYKENK
jgi:hypothetical protein